MGEPSEPEVDFTKLPVDERCAHKNWKARVSGYEALALTFQTQDDEKSTEFLKYAPLVRKFPVDSNAAAQEKGLTAVLAFVENGSAQVIGRVAGDIIEGIITKCLISPKVKTREAAQVIVLMYIEAEKQDIVVDQLVNGLESKSPKVVGSCIALLRESLKAFGPKVVKINVLIKSVLKKMDDRDKSIRDETKQLAVEIYRWMKEVFKPQLQGLKAVQLTELETEFEKVKDEKPTASRYLRSEQARASHSVAAVGEDLGDGNQMSAVARNDDIDPFELVEPVEILSKLPGDFYDQCEAKKWQDRKSALETLMELMAPNPKLVGGDYGELVKILRKFISKDNNVVVVALAAKALAELASRLRKLFHAYAHGCVTVILEKFKEKKQNVVTALREAADAVMLSISLEAIAEDVVTALDNKNPQIKAETGNMLTRQFKLSTPPVLSNKKLLKQLCAGLVKALNDMDGTVRDAAAEAIGTVMKVIGDKLLVPYLLEVDAIKMGKIKEFCEKAEVKYPCPPGGHPVPRPAAKGGLAPPARVPSSSASHCSSRSGSTDDISGESKPVKKTVKPGAKVTKPGAAKTDSGTLKKGPNSLSAPSVGSKTMTRPKTAVPAKAKSRSSLSGGTASKEDKEPMLPLIAVNNMKEQRLADEKAFRVLKWNFSAPRDEFYVQLKEQMIAASWNMALVGNCFHVDFKYHLKAIDELANYLNLGNAEATLCNSDLILKWMALRFFDTNPSVILRGLDYMISLFAAYKESDQPLIDAEANSFFPYLMLKSGDPKDIIRQKVHEILLKAKDIYAPVKLFNFVMVGLTTKNARQRCTCLDELSYLIESYGLSVCQPSAPVALKEIAKQIADRDNGVRNSALNCVVQAYFIEGEKVYKHVGKLSDKDMGMLEERIKRMSKNRPPPIAKAPSTAPPAAQPTGKAKVVVPTNILESRTPSPEETPVRYNSPAVRGGGTITKSQRPKSIGPLSLNVAEMEQQMQEDLSPTVNYRGRQSYTVDRRDHQQHTNNYQRQPVLSVEDLLNMPDVQLPERRLSYPIGTPPLTSPAASPMAKMVSLSPKADVALNLVLAQTMAQEIPAAIEAFAQLRQVLDRPDKAEAFLSSKVDQIIIHCNFQYRLALNKHMSDDNLPKSQVIALFKVVTNILDCLFKHPVLKKNATRDNLQDLMPHVISIIIDPRLAELSEGPLVIRSVNILATVIITSAQPTNMMSALIKLLHDCVAGSSGNQGSKFTEMVMKCIWKMVRFMDQFIDDLNIDRILYDVHQFLKEFPSDFWKLDPNRADTPLRTVKTITYLLVQQKGALIMNHLSLVTDRNQSELCTYIQRALKQLSKGTGENNVQDAGSALKPSYSSSSSTLSSTYKMSKGDSNELSLIIAKLGTANTQEGFFELFHFCETHPQFSLETHLQKSSSEFFQSFVINGLTQIKAEREKLKVATQRLPEEDAHESNKNGSSVEDRFQLQGNTPKLPLSRSKLAPLSANTSIPSPIAVRSIVAPQLPPANALTTKNVFEWAKASGAMLGKDLSKYDDPQVIENILNPREDRYRFSGNPLEDFEMARRMAEETQDNVKNFKLMLANRKK